MAAAENAGARVLLGFSHSRSRFKRRAQVAALAAPLPARVPALPGALPVRHDLPDLERGEPLRPADVEPPRAGGRYYDILRTDCRECTIVGAVRARLDRDAALGQQVEKAAKHRIGIWAHPQLHRRQPLPHARHALAAARDEGEDLVHRDRRARAPRQRLADRVRRARRGTREGDEVGAQARPPEPPRPARSTSTTGPRPRPRPPGTRR